MLDYSLLGDRLIQRYRFDEVKVCDTQRFLDRNLLEIEVGCDEDSFYKALYIALCESQKDNVAFRTVGHLKMAVKVELCEKYETVTSYMLLQAAAVVCSRNIEVFIQGSDKLCFKSTTSSQDGEETLFLRYVERQPDNFQFSALISLEDAFNMDLCNGTLFLNIQRLME